MSANVALALEAIGWGTADHWMRMQASYELGSGTKGTRGAPALGGLQRAAAPLGDLQAFQRYPPVADTVLQKPDQPVPIDSVEVRPDIRIDNPTDPTPIYPESQGVERIVRPTSGSEPIAESEEFRLENRQKDGLRHRLADREPYPGSGFPGLSYTLFYVPSNALGSGSSRAKANRRDHMRLCIGDRNGPAPAGLNPTGG